MQHYGVPTRLLYWTTPALVALFFAIESNPSSKEERLYDCSPEEQFLDNDEFCTEGADVFDMSPSKFTNCSILKILIASHIVPWKEASDNERLDVENGILLSPTIDALFDKHLISFNDDGSIIIGT